MSTDADVQAMYDTIAEHYDQMVDQEIDGPPYTDVLGRLAKRLNGRSGPVADTACGGGHMLHRYHVEFDPDRELVGLDLSPAMVALAAARLGDSATVSVGDMRSPGSLNAAALINYFALHHLEPKDARQALQAWFAALRPGGQLLVATWEGEGLIDYGEAADLEARRFRADQLRTWAVAAGFQVDRCEVHPVEGMEMDAIYLEATRSGAAGRPPGFSEE